MRAGRFWGFLDVFAPGRKLSVRDDILRFDLRPFEVKTFKLRLDISRSGS